MCKLHWRLTLDTRHAVHVLQPPSLQLIVLTSALSFDVLWLKNI